MGLRGDDPVAFLFYGDASGTSDRSNIAVGGYVSTVENWKSRVTKIEEKMES